LALLVFFQFQFLPYHPSRGIALWQRASVVLDLILLWMLWPSVSRGTLTSIGWSDFRRAIIVPAALCRVVARRASSAHGFYTRWFACRVVWRVLPRATVAVAAVGSLIPVLLVFTVSTFPGEWLNDTQRWLYDRQSSLPIIRHLHGLLFAATPNELTGRPGGWFSNVLVLTNQTFVDSDKIEKIDVSHAFRGRDLNYAVFSGANLRKADFTGAKLRYAKFSHAILQDARFECASGGNATEECADLNGADLKGSTLRGARLTGATLNQAHLEEVLAENAIFQSAKLEGAHFTDAQLQAADFTRAQLQASDFTHANLQDSNLSEAKGQLAVFAQANLRHARLGAASLQGANFGRAKLQGADAGAAQFQKAYMVEAELQGTVLGNAGLQGADLSKTNLDGTDLSLAEIQGTSLFQAKLRGANLRQAKLQGANLTCATLQGASLKEASTWRAWVKLSCTQPPANDLFPRTPENSPSLNFELVDLDRVDSKNPPWNQETPQQWRDQLLLQVQDSTQKNDVRSVLDPNNRPRVIEVGGVQMSMLGSDTEPESVIDGDLPNFVRQRAFAQQELAGFLADLMCSDVEVARGLIRSRRIFDTGAQIASIAERLKKQDAAASCPAVSDFIRQDWASFDALVSETTKAATGGK
jgi:uncharacterized protein YjbI with pentapeptide repeats